jgi:flagellar hook-associated protein 3 FlgL
VDLYTLQNQLSSGLKTDNFSGLGGDTEKFVDLDARLGRTQTYIDSSQLASDRLSITDNVLGQVIDIGTDIKNLIALRRNSAVGDDVAFQTQLRGKWQALAAVMNTTSEGRYIFSGTRTDTPAVDTDFMPVLQTDGTPDTGYYNGNSEDITVRVEDNVNISYNVRADDPAIQKIFAGIATAYKYGSSFAGESVDLQKAYDFLQEGVDGVISTRATVNANIVNVSDNKDRLSSMQLYWKGLKETISNTDIVSVSTEVAVNQGILQAAYQAFAKISSLKLADFLR